MPRPRYKRTPPRPPIRSERRPRDDEHHHVCGGCAGRFFCCEMRGSLCHTCDDFNHAAALDAANDR